MSKRSTIDKVERLPRYLRETGRVALRQGWRIRMTGGEHLLWLSPDGERIVTALTPSDHRAHRNVRSRFRRAGLSV